MSSTSNVLLRWKWNHNDPVLGRAGLARSGLKQPLWKKGINHISEGNFSGEVINLRFLCSLPRHSRKAALTTAAERLFEILLLL